MSLLFFLRLAYLYSKSTHNIRTNVGKWQASSELVQFSIFLPLLFLSSSVFLQERGQLLETTTSAYLNKHETGEMRCELATPTTSLFFVYENVNDEKMFTWETWWNWSRALESSRELGWGGRKIMTWKNYFIFVALELTSLAAFARWLLAEFVEWEC